MRVPRKLPVCLKETPRLHEARFVLGRLLYSLVLRQRELSRGFDPRGGDEVDISG